MARSKILDGQVIAPKLDVDHRKPGFLRRLTLADWMIIGGALGVAAVLLAKGLGL